MLRQGIGLTILSSTEVANAHQFPFLRIVVVVIVDTTTRPLCFHDKVTFCATMNSNGTIDSGRAGLVVTTTRACRRYLLLLPRLRRPVAVGMKEGRKEEAQYRLDGLLFLYEFCDE